MKLFVNVYKVRFWIKTTFFRRRDVKYLYISTFRNLVWFSHEEQIGKLLIFHV